MSASAYEVTRQTLLILLPELLILLTATVMMTLGVFVRWPRRVLVRSVGRRRCWQPWSFCSRWAIGLSICTRRWR